ncbi:hypothetical protein FGRMN_2554 [Fusarium graminum]|nr:hypothetical protein FGRMN_2554 [Fusarium graminum]
MSVQLFSQPLPIAQNSTLVLMPTELLESIVKLISTHQHDSRQTLDRLSQTCARMYQIARPYFYRADNCLQFYQAIAIANLPTMDRCEYFGAAPVDIIWNRPFLRVCRPVDLLLSNLNEGLERRDTVDRAALRDRQRDNIFYALGWLLERGADGEARMANESPYGLDLPSGHMSSMILKQFQIGTSQRGSEVLFNMIRMLNRYGHSNPTRSDAITGWLGIDQAAWFKDTMVCYHTTSPLELALKSHVIPSFLELMLEEYSAQGLKLSDWHNECPPSLVGSATLAMTIGTTVNWVEVSHIDTLLGTLHADLHNESTRWNESYSGEVADIFSQKLDIMTKHEMIDNAERTLLLRIEAALYRIADEGRAAGGLGEEHFKMSWEILCNAVRPLARDAALEDNWLTAPGGNGPGRIHRFAIWSHWNPWKDWMLRCDARLRHRKMLASGAISQVPAGVWECAAQYGSYFIDQHVDYTQVPPWHTVGLDEWIEAVEKSRAFVGMGFSVLTAGTDGGL